jgi:hypothetical protein
MGQYEAGISKQKQALGMYQDMAGTERDQVYLSSVSGTATETRLSLENKATYIPESRARVLWLRCVPLIKGFDHLTLLCTEFESWYNAWRPHMTLEGRRLGSRPALV